jgi:hypothetical protein
MKNHVYCYAIMYVVFSRYMYFLFGSLFLKNFGLSSHVCSAAADKPSIMLSFVAALTAAAGPSWPSSSSCNTAVVQITK